MPDVFQTSNCTWKPKSSICSSTTAGLQVCARKRHVASWMCMQTSSLARMDGTQSFNHARAFSGASSECQLMCSGCASPKSRMIQNRHWAFSNTASCSCCSIAAITGNVDSLFRKAASTRSKHAVCRNFKMTSSASPDF